MTCPLPQLRAGAWLWISRAEPDATWQSARPATQAPARPLSSPRSSRFSPSALVLAEQFRYKLSLQDFERVSLWIKKVSGAT